MSSLCDRTHATLIFGVCPWCQRRVVHGHAEGDYDALKRRILWKLRDLIDVSRAQDHHDLLRREIEKAVERLCVLKAVVLSQAELECLVEEILGEFFDEPEARR